MAPRIYTSEDPILAQRFGEFEAQTRAWDRARYLYEDSNAEELWTNAADTANALADLVEHAHTLVSQPDADRRRAAR